MSFKKILCTSEDLDFVKKQFRFLNIKKDIKDKFIKDNPEFIISFTDLGEKVSIDVLIIEDDISYIFKYIQELISVDDSLSIIACTKSFAAKSLISFLLEKKEKVQLVILDFDLNQFPTSNQEAEAKEAFSLYKFIDTHFNHNFKIYGLTAYEGAYDYKDFKKLENEMRRRNDDVYNKQQVSKERGFLANLYRNAIVYYENNKTLENAPSEKEQHTENRSHNTKIDIEKPTKTKFERANPFLKKIENCISKECPNNEKFEYTKHYNKILSSSGNPFSSQQTLAGAVINYSVAINYIIYLSKDEDFPSIKYQIKNYNLFSTQGIRLYK